MSHDGLSDSVRELIISHDPYDRVLLRMLLNAFFNGFMYEYVTIVLFILKAINIIAIIININACISIYEHFYHVESTIGVYGQTHYA